MTREGSRGRGNQLGHRDGGALALKVYVHTLPEGLARAGAHLDQVLAGQQ
jgi:hypothetical protein